MRRLSRFVALTGALATSVWPLTVAPLFAGHVIVGAGPVFVPDLGPSGAGVSDTAARIATEIELSRQYCGWITQKEYVVDCLSDELNRVAGMVPDTAEWAPTRSALRSASKQLSDIVAENESAALKPGIARVTTSDDPRTSTRPLRAVDTAKLDEVSAAAIGIIEETGTLLLRSSSQSDEAAGFVAISAAVRSNTILLRSL
jgi:hypothetical protein